MKCQNKIFLLILSICLILINAGIVSAQENSLSKSVDKNINIALYIINMGKFNIAEGSFTVDFYLSFYCDNICPPYDFEFMNGNTTNLKKTLDKPNEKQYRIQANLVSPIDLRKFPFDKQKLKIVIEDNKSIEKLNYIPLLKQSGIDDSIAFIGWNLDGWKAYAKPHKYNIWGTTYPQYVFEVEISRILINAFLKTFLPMIFIILGVLFSFVLDLDKITTRLTMISSAMVASVMFHVSLVNQIPPVSYLTFVDKFMLLSYFVIIVSFIFNIILLALFERKKEELVKKLHKSTEFTMFILIPLFYVLLFTVFT